MSLNSDFIFPDFLDNSERFDVVSEPFAIYDPTNPYGEFERVQRKAEERKGLVMSRLNESYVDIVEVEPHDFNSDDPLDEAKSWAEKNLVNIYVSHVGTICEFTYEISKKTLKKYLDPSATNKSDNLLVHLSVLKVLPKVIDASIEAEIHADYTKENNTRSNNNCTNKSVLIHRFYGAIKFLDTLYRVKITIKEFKQPDRFRNKPYTFEVIKIELLDIKSNSSILDSKAADSIESGRLSVAKLLQNIEKSYDKGKFLLDESK